MSSQRVTINDVARRSGVSKVTVSYVLNGRRTRIAISEATRERVLSAARELGYHPNALARGLARRQTDTVALVVHSPRFLSGGSGFVQALLRGVLNQASELGLDVMLHTKPLPDLEQEVQALADGRVDGALLLRDMDDPLAGRLAERGFPFVQVFGRSLVPGVWFVDCDNVTGGRLATGHLLELGHRRIGHLGGPSHAAAAADRYRGYCQALEAAGVPPRPEWRREITRAGGDFAPLVAMMRAPEPPTALFAWSDDVAIRAIRVLGEELGLRVPEDVSVLGFDGTELGEVTTPRLTTVRQPITEIAARGVELLVARIRNQPVAQQQVFFAPELVRRESCAPPAPAGALP